MPCYLMLQELTEFDTGDGFEDSTEQAPFLSVSMCVIYLCVCGGGGGGGGLKNARPMHFYGHRLKFGSRTQSS